MMRCAVFASGGGSNFQVLIDRWLAGDLHADLALLLTNNSKSGASERARRHSIAVAHCASSGFPDHESYVRQLLDIVEKHRIDFIVLAGYMKKIPPLVVQRFRNRILNIHPALLPAFGGPGMYGHHVHEAVIASGVKVSGISIHFVDEEYDHGPVIMQEVIRILDTDDADSLAHRILGLEHAWYWRVVDAVAQDKILVVNGRATGFLSGTID